MVGYRPWTAPLCLSSDFYQHHRPERDPLIMGGISAQQPCVLFFVAFSPRGFSVPYGHCGHLEILFRSIITRSAAAGWSRAEQREVEGAPADPCLFTDPGRHPGVTSDKTTFQPQLIRLHPARPIAPT